MVRDLLMLLLAALLYQASLKAPNVTINHANSASTGQPVRHRQHTHLLTSSTTPPSHTLHRSPSSPAPYSDFWREITQRL